MDISKGAEGYYQVGSARPVEIVQGNVEISGSLSRVWMDTTLASLVGTAPEQILAAFTLTFRASTTADGTCPEMTIAGCKVESASIDISQDGYVMGDIDFLATTYAISTVT